ncbi:ABC transporter ATP-binding protein [Pseudaestuariivita rosea]|uniref:ABC transporter ATP-binding protein n=1 Tax=Pseudaestuariivita rosea TaxID=2763263 RepID=UPI001ABBD758|nr:ABC transporter ATP-binding protein [Pseudaestuariivita rosea]
MTALLELEDFGVPEPQPNVVSETELEEAKLDAFENGYKAGWADAEKSADDARTRITAEFAQNLQDLSFTYHEARSHILKTLEPVFREMTAAVLPKIAQDSLLPMIVDQIMKAANGTVDAPMHIAVAEENLPQLESMIPETQPFPLTVFADASLSVGQAFIQHGSTAQHIDMDHTTHKIRQLVEDFFTLSQEDTQNDRSQHPIA